MRQTQPEEPQFPAEGAVWQFVLGVVGLQSQTFKCEMRFF